jgi:hypothetical protein
MAVLYIRKALVIDGLIYHRVAYDQLGAGILAGAGDDVGFTDTWRSFDQNRHARRQGLGKQFI